MKNVRVLFSLLMLTLGFAQAQEKRINGDYQYLRTGNDYHAYTTFIKIDELGKHAEIELVTSLSFEKLQTITITKGTKLVKVTFAALNTTIVNDDKSLHGISILPSFDNLWKINVDCETRIIFTFDNGKKIDLPFMYCFLKEQLNNS
ncbi:MAG: hypothetical protein EOP00_15365 [Pedobacter sp.]|nr:MAG: hypothetical protein EOP00_15365 [Pedobacter sp.]